MPRNTVLQLPDKCYGQQNKYQVRKGIKGCWRRQKMLRGLISLRQEWCLFTYTVVQRRSKSRSRLPIFLWQLARDPKAPERGSLERG